MSFDADRRVYLLKSLMLLIVHVKLSWHKDKLNIPYAIATQCARCDPSGTRAFVCIGLWASG